MKPTGQTDLGSGPFRLTNLQKISLKAFAHYTQHCKDNFKKVIVKIVAHRPI